MKKALIFDCNNNFLQAIITNNFDGFLNKQIFFVDELPDLTKVKPYIDNFNKIKYEDISKFNFTNPPSSYHTFDLSLKEWVIDEEGKINLIKELRNKLLQLSDWTQLPDVPLQTKEAWLKYRQELRDITLQPDYPLNIVWPTPP